MSEGKSATAPNYTGEQPPLILVADDEATLRIIVKSFLTDYDFRVIEAKNGQEALELIEQKKPDFVLLDLIMPQVNGFEVLEKIKESNLKVPIVVITGSLTVDDAVRVEELGAVACLQKPIKDMNDLFKLIEEHVGFKIDYSEL